MPHGPVAAVASLAKNGNVYMRVAQCHNVACIGYVLLPPPSPRLSECANVHVCVGNTFCVLLITWPGWPAGEEAGEGGVGDCQSDSRLVCAVSEGHVHALSPGGLCLVIASW